MGRGLMNSVLNVTLDGDLNSGIIVIHLADGVKDLTCTVLGLENKEASGVTE